MGELLIVLLVVLLVFGASRLPQIGEGLGKAIKSLKRGLAADDDIDVTPEKKQVSSDSSAEKVDEGKPQGGSSTSNVSDAEIVDQKQS
jgi:sec-independent protein translocase protein TatA